MPALARLAAPAAAVLMVAGAVAAATALPARAEPADPAAVSVSAPEVFAGVKLNMPLGTGGLAATLLQLPIGTYTITAKAVATDSSATGSDVRCKLHLWTTGADFDISEASLVPAARRQTLSLHVTQILNSPAPVLLSCTSSAGGNVTLTYARVTAVRVADPNHLHLSTMP